MILGDDSGNEDPEKHWTGNQPFGIRTIGLALGGVLCVATILRADHLADRSIWLDEAFSWVLATQYSWAEMIERTANDTHPPFYYCLLRLWIFIFGDSLIAMRSLSVLFSLMALIGVYRIGRLLLPLPDHSTFPFSKRVGSSELSSNAGIGLLAMSLLGINSSYIQWSQEVRMYSLGTMLTVWSSLFLFHAVSPETIATPIRDRTTRIAPAPQWSWWIAYSVSAIALMYTHHYGLFTIAAQACFVLTVSFAKNVDCSLGDVIKGLASFLVVLACYSPWVPILIEQKRRVQSEFWIPPLSLWTVPDAWSRLLFPVNQPETVTNHFVSTVIVNVVAITWLLFIVRSRTRADVMVICLGTIPVLCAVAVSAISVSVITSRHFLFVLPFFLLAFARVFWEIFGPRIRVLTIGLLLVNLLTFHLFFRSQLDVPNRPGVQALVHKVSQQFIDGDMIVVAHPAILYPLRYTLTQDETMSRAIPEARSAKLFRSGEIEHFVGSAIINEDDLISWEGIIDQNSHRIWVIDTTGFAPRDQNIQIALRNAGWERSSQWAFAEVHSFQGLVSATLYENNVR